MAISPPPGASSTAQRSTAEVACPCLNVRVRYEQASSGNDRREQRVKLVEDGVSTVLPLLVGRELVNVPGASSNFAVPALRCVHCGTAVYAVDKAVSSGPTRSIGFATNKTSSTASPDSPRRSASAKDAILRPADGWVHLLPGCISGEEIEKAMSSLELSPIFGLIVNSNDTEASSSAVSQPTTVRPALSKNRKSSFSQYSTTGQYGLQPIPQHIVTSPPPESPSVKASTSESIGSPSWLGRAIDPLASQLDSVASEKLKQWRSSAEQELLEFTRRKRRELEELVSRASAEGESLLERVKNVPVPLASVTRADGSSSVETSPVRSRDRNGRASGRSRDASVATPERSAVVDRSSASNLAEVKLTQDAFQRRPTGQAAAYRVTSSTGAAISSSLSALSASFAMRGRDAPIHSDEWAQKRRLKERYPDGDHSVMTSAATSAANSFSEQESLAGDQEEEEEEEQEQESRGRGRSRGPQVAQNRHPANLGTTAVAPGTVSRPTMAPSSLSTSGKALPSTSLDLGRNFDSDTPRPGGLLGAIASPAADVHLRPRNPPPNGAEPLKPATRQANKVKDLNATPRKGVKVEGATGEKKVAFAETTDQVDSPANFVDSEEEPKEPVDEGGSAVFEIDEEIDENSESPIEGARADALKAAAGQVGEKAPATEFDVESANEERGSDADSDLGGVPASVGGFQAGSLSALAASDKRRASLAKGKSATAGQGRGFDPASLRLDGRVVDPDESSPKKRSVSGSRAREDQRVVSSSDYDDGDVKSRSGWAGQVGVGYRTTIGDTELRLSGLLAPHAPSHRTLWGRERKKREQKYLQNDSEDEEEDKIQISKVEASSAESAEDKGWFAWQMRAKQIEADAKKQQEDRASGNLASSMPSDRGMLVGSMQIPTGQRRGSHFPGQSTTVYDATSGFDREPKTSLPYQERQMVPSLRRAMRRSVLGPSTQHQPNLATIPDAEGDAESSHGGSGMGPSQTMLQPGKPAASTAGAIATEAAAPIDSQAASVVTKGFDVAPKDDSQTTQGVVQPAGADPHASGGSGDATGSKAQNPATSTTTALAKGDELQVPTTGATHSPMLSSGQLSPNLTQGSGKVSPSGRRSPRPQYIPPPQPASTTIVLQPDPAQKPAQLNLFKASADERFSMNEPQEDDESDWSKVLGFMHRVEQLKMNKRTGWMHHRVRDCESIADHMYRMGILAMLCPNVEVDIGKCVMLCLIHDLAEAEVGDLTPLDGVSKEEKVRREAEALAYLVHDLLGSSPAALRLEALWHEYEDRQTLESLLVKDLDRFELLLQATEYETRYGIEDLQGFYSCAGDIGHPRIRKWTVELAREREALWRGRGSQWEYKQDYPQQEREEGKAAPGA